MRINFIKKITRYLINQYKLKGTSMDNEKFKSIKLLITMLTEF